MADDNKKNRGKPYEFDHTDRYTMFDGRRNPAAKWRSGGADGADPLDEMKSTLKFLKSLENKSLSIEDSGIEKTKAEGSDPYNSKSK